MHRGICTYVLLISTWVHMHTTVIAYQSCTPHAATDERESVIGPAKYKGSLSKVHACMQFGKFKIANTHIHACVPFKL